MAEAYASVFRIHNQAPTPNFEYRGHLMPEPILTSEKVHSALAKLTAQKHPGPDEVHPMIVCLLTPILIKPLCASSIPY